MTEKDVADLVRDLRLASRDAEFIYDNGMELCALAADALEHSKSVHSEPMKALLAAGYKLCEEAAFPGLRREERPVKQWREAVSAALGIPFEDTGLNSDHEAVREIVRYQPPKPGTDWPDVYDHCGKCGEIVEKEDAASHKCTSESGSER